MSLETKIAEAFERHAGDVAPRPEAWTGVERAVARSHRRRRIAASIGAAAAIAALAVVAPRLGADTPPPVVPGPVDSAERDTFRSAPDGFLIEHPRSWSARRDDRSDVTTVVPSGVATGGGKPLFSVSIALVPGDYEQGMLFARKAPEYRVTTGRLAGGQSYVRVERRAPEGVRSVRYFVDWTTPLCRPDAPCPRPAEGKVLDVTLSASTPAVWARYGATAERVAASIRAIAPPPSGPPAVVAKIPVAAADLATGVNAAWAISRPETAGQPGRLVRVDAATNRVAGETEVGAWPTAVAADGDAVWVANGIVDGVAAPFPATDSVMRVDPSTGDVVAAIRVRSPQDVVIDANGTVWVTASGESGNGSITLVGIDPQTNRVFARIDIPGASAFAHAAMGPTGSDGRPEVWVATGPPPGGAGDRTLLHRIDLQTGAVSRTIEIPAGDGDGPVTVGLGAVWVGIPGRESASALARVDPRTNRVAATFDLPDAAPVGLSSLATGEGSVWASGGRGALWRVDPATNTPLGDPVFVGDDPPAGAGEIVYGLGSLWVAIGDGQVWRFEP